MRATNVGLAVCLALGLTNPLTARGATYTMVDMTAQLNGIHDHTAYPEPPTGTVLAPDGVPMQIRPYTGPNCWRSDFVSGSNPISVSIPVNVAGARAVHTIINTTWGQPGPTSYAYLEFLGSGGAYFRKDLVGDVDIRDRANFIWTWKINGTTTINFWDAVGDGLQRLDKQRVELPPAFYGQTLTEVRLVDNGGTEFQRTFIMATTVEVPEPATLSLLTMGCLAVMRRRWR